MRHIDRGDGHLRVGRLLLCWPVRQGLGTAIVDGCTSHLERRDSDSHEVIERVAFGGLALRPWWRPNALAVTWRGARVRDPGRWFRRGFLSARLRWVLAGRPRSRPMTSMSGS